MQDYNENGSTPLYPVAKTYDELEMRHKLRDIARRPRFVALKVASWTTLAFAVALSMYQFIVFLMSSNLSAAGEIMFGVFASIVLAVVALAILAYMYSLINSIATRALASSTIFYMSLILIMTIAGLMLQNLTQHYNIAMLVAGGLTFNFLATIVAVGLIVKHQD